MPAGTSVVIDKHTTSSTPRPHILYSIKVVQNDGIEREVLRRYSEFLALHQYLNDTYNFPQKHTLAIAVSPSAWVDDQLITERKAALTAYLNSLLRDQEYQTNPVLLQFLTSMSQAVPGQVGNKVALPLMVSKNMVLNVKATDTFIAATPIAAAYYPSWSAESHPPNKLDFSKFDILFFAFVTPNSNSTIDWDEDSEDTLEKLVSSAHKSGKGTKIVLSIGGWAGCHWFSQATSNSANRKKLTDSLVDAVHSFGLDGVDIDWEYPNSRGAGNPHSPADAANLLRLIKSLRDALGQSKIISAAVTHLPWLGPNGKPLNDVSDYAAQMTYVNIMNYDVFQSSSNPGPNAPLGNPCGTSEQPQANAQAALAQWKRAGFPASKLLLGVPLYGYVSKSTATELSGSLMPSPDNTKISYGAHPRNPNNPGPSRKPGDLSDWWGEQVAFSQLLASGALVKKSDGTYTAANGYTMGWDDCSNTPFLFNVARSTFVSYDDTWSLADKAKFAKQSGMAGCFTWSLDQDDGVALQKVIRSNLGK